jgi:thiol-activated cytolysin
MFPLSLSHSFCAYWFVGLIKPFSQTKFYIKMNPLRFFSLSLLLMVLSTSCKKPIEGPGPGGTFAEVISNGGQFETFETQQNIATKDSSEYEQNGERWLCVTKTYDLVESGEEYFNFNPSSEIIWPGNLLQGNSITEPTPNPIVVKRGAGCVTIDLVNGSTGTQNCMDKVTQGNIISGLNEIIDQNNGVLPANFAYSFEEVQSQQEMAFKMGVNFHSLSTDVKAKLSLNQSSEYHSYLVTLTQNFYTMIFEKPTSYSEMFGPNVTPADLAPYIGPGNPATYISSVTYGRRFYLLVESTESRTEMKASIKASYDAAVVGGSLSAGAKYVGDLENSSIKVFALGGDQGLALATFNGDMNAVGTFLTEGGDYRTGVPLSYVIRSLETHQDLAIKVATQYETNVCEPILFDKNPPPYTAFWGQALDSIGAITLTPEGNVLIFNMAGTEYYHCDQNSLTYTGPFDLDDPNGYLKDCPFEAVTAAQMLPSGNIYLHGPNGTQYVAFKTNGTYADVRHLSVWGNDNHPFDLFGISAACEDLNDRVIHFSKDGTQYSYYRKSGDFGPVYNLWQWGPDHTCPIDAVGAAVRLDLAHRYYIMFDPSGTTYAIYKGAEGFIGYFQL